MQVSPVSPPDLNSPLSSLKQQPKQQQQRRRRRRRQRNRKKQQRQQEYTQQQQQHIYPTQTHFDLTELMSEASALERQLGELQAQLKINHANMPGKEQGRRANAVAADQIAATEEEIQYVRKSLKSIYSRILSEDVLYAGSNHVEDKLWRYICYPAIEEVRSKLRKLPPRGSDSGDVATRERLQKLLLKRIDSTFKFYRDQNAKIKNDHHVDIKTIGIDLFRQNASQSSSSEDFQLATILQSNYNCMGDIARYRASAVDKSVSAEHWKTAKDCYQKAAEVYRFSGKPYCQMALVSISNGSVIDVVWHYCMNLAMKYPFPIGRDNLRAFYSKIRFSTNPKEVNNGSVSNSNGTKMISQYVELFLQLHKQIMFGNSGTEEMSEYPILLDSVIRHIITIAADNPGDETISKTITSTIQVLKNMLSRTVVILVITIWDLGERMKNKSNLPQMSQLQGAQMRLLEYGFRLLQTLVRTTEDSWSDVKGKIPEEKYHRLTYMVEYALLSGLSVWCTYLSYNLPVIAQYCAMGQQQGSNSHNEQRRRLAIALQSFVSCLLGHPMFPDPVVNALPPTYPVSEDLVLLGVLPLARFHATVDFFKEVDYSSADESSVDARRHIRWGRVRELVRKLAESSSFDFVQYNKVDQKYSVFDENAKRQQQSRFMKALATQRLMEQVSSLEKNVNRMNLTAALPGVQANGELNVYTVVLDVTAFLDGLGKVKKWANQTVNPNSRTQTTILEVVVPLETIDSLDFHKKGSSHMNMQARESIRYLDEHLIRDPPPHASFLRTQKVSEQLSEWSQAEQYWIGEESRANIVDALLSDEDDDDNSDAVVAEIETSDEEDDHLFRSRRRTYDDESDMDDSDYSSEEEDTDESSEEDERLNDAGAEDVLPAQFSQVPRIYQPIISCMLYYMKKQLVLVTNDENLAWWTEMFGDPESGRRLNVKTVDEWDQMVRNMSFEPAYTHSWKKR
ncbi:hypothetical protein BX666DRAFT_1905040 [Dichotomocladium elegans]|nr:hypothetical protein BX666DRAFT_1905040 [Dichotomocladium elegans]